MAAAAVTSVVVTAREMGKGSVCSGGCHGIRSSGVISGSAGGSGGRNGDGSCGFSCGLGDGGGSGPQWLVRTTMTPYQPP